MHLSWSCAIMFSAHTTRRKSCLGFRQQSTFSDGLKGQRLSVLPPPNIAGGGRGQLLQFHPERVVRLRGNRLQKFNPGRQAKHDEWHLLPWHTPILTLAHPREQWPDLKGASSLSLRNREEPAAMRGTEVFTSYVRPASSSARRRGAVGSWVMRAKTSVEEARLRHVI